MEATHLTTSRGTFPAIADGDPGAPVVLCLHGFPDTPHTFDALFPALAAAGFRAIAPWLRGYFPSPADPPFGIAALGEDLIAQAAACGGPVFVVGHDWGALAMYQAFSQRPELFSRGVSLAVPHLRSYLINARTEPGQWARSGYIAGFQVRGLAERRLQANHFAQVDELWAKWSPAYRPSNDHLEDVKLCLARSGAGPLLHYRALPGEVISQRVGGKVQVPTRVVLGQDDGCIAPSLAAGQEKAFRGAFDQQVLEGCGHFLHLEKPAQVFALIASWLRSG